LNLYAERQPPDAKSPVTVHGVPGITTYATLGEGPIRGFHVMGGVLYVVSGPWLYSVSSTPTPVVTRIGGQILGSGVVSMDDNGDQLMIVNGSNGFVYDTVSGFRIVTDTDFAAANTVAQLDGFFLFDRIGTNQVFRSDLLDGTSYEALAFASKESKSDNVQAVVNVKQVAHFLGERSSELFANAGAAFFPFQRIPGGTIDRGIIAPHAHAQEDQTLFLIGDDRIAYKLGGTQLGRISTHAIEQEWGKYTSVGDCIGLAFTHKGHKFVYFTFPSQQASLGNTTTWGFDIATGLWHERLSFDMNGTPLGRWRANCAIEAYNKTFIGDCLTGKIGYIDGTVDTEFDDPIHIEAVSPPLGDGVRWHTIDQFQLDMATGVGVAAGQGSNPQVMLSLSEDGGHTWLPYEDWTSLGEQGAYKTQVYWNRLGGAYTMLLKVRITDPVKRTITAAHADVKVGL